MKITLIIFLMIVCIFDIIYNSIQIKRINMVYDTEREYPLSLGVG